MARDCTVNRDPNAVHAPPNPNMIKGGFDSEYASLMAELGETGKGPGGDAGRLPWTGSAGHDITAGGSNIPPWRRPEVWQSAVPSNTQGGGGGGGPGGGGGYRPQGGGSYNGYGSAPGYGAGAGGGAGAGAAPAWGGQAAAGYGQGANSGYYPQSQDYGAGYAQYYQNQYSQQQISTPTQ